MMEQGAAPAGGVRKPRTPGGAGAPPGTTTGPCEELADGGPLRSARGPEAAVTQRRRELRAGGRTKRSAGKARPGAEMRTPRWRAERRHVPRETRART